MNTTPKFFKNQWGDLQGKLDVAVWSQVRDAWDAKQYLQAFHKLLDYVNVELRANFGDASQTQFTIPHGSVIVTIKITGDTIAITCPLVDITNAVRIPVLRRMAELNFSPLNLAQVKLTGNQLAFNYTAALDTCEPYKMYYVLREICQTADRYDDELIEKFKATTLQEPKVKRPSPAQIDSVWNSVLEIIQETNSYIQYFNGNNWQGSSLDMLILACKRIDLCTQVQGYTKSELEQMLGTLQDGKISTHERIQSGQKFFQQLQAAGKEAFQKNLYETVVFVPEKSRVNGEQVKNIVKGYHEQAVKYNNDKNYIGSCIESLYCYYDLFYKNSMDHAINDLLLEALGNAAGKSWQDSSPVLIAGLQTIVNTNYSNN
jgi:hypothetical protein